MMGVLSTVPTYEPDLAARSTSATTFSSASSNASTSIQSHTVLAIVIGLVGFIILIVATAFISRLQCLSQSRGIPKISVLPLRGNIYTRNAAPDRRLPSRARPPIYHVDPTIVTPSTAFAAPRAPPGLLQTFDLPPYGGPSPPPYAENTTAVQPPQHTP